MSGFQYRNIYNRGRNTPSTGNEVSDEALALHEAVGNHGYVPMAVHSNGTIDLANPWGASHVQGLSINDFMRFFNHLRVVNA